MGFHSVIAGFKEGDYVQVNDRDEMQVEYNNTRDGRIDVLLHRMGDKYYSLQNDSQVGIALFEDEEDGSRFDEEVETLTLIAEP